LVAAMTITWSSVSKPSISTRIALSVCSRSSWPPPLKPAPRAADRVDLVEEDDAGRVLLGLLEQVAHAEAPTPTNISTKSEPEIEKNGTSASPAIALASSVLPQPGSPTSSTPRGMRPPSRWNFLGFLRNSMIS
jgi:hypothetical protein